ncbi:colicin immunity domain-containing protein [Streptomyces sp. KR80]|uniref:colicin immunity domain-containing protein n=1 Tax=Streptomyces sp. KR80 TaxID=3457426 RepID=UPI003FCEF603
MKPRCAVGRGADSACAARSVLSADRTCPLSKHISLATSLTSGKISFQEFESQFLRLFKEEDALAQEHFTVLNELFYAVESYVADESLREEGELSDEHLLDAVVQFLRHSRPGPDDQFHPDALP